MENIRLYNSYDNILANRNEVFNLANENINNSLSNLLYFINETFESSSAFTSTINTIQEIVNKINKAKTPEEIINLRNKLNYHFNKIKNKIYSSTIANELKELFYININAIKNNISNYLRIFKREIKLDEIKKLLTKKTLTNEEKEYLSSIIKNERRFNARWLNRNTTRKNKVKTIESTNINTEEKTKNSFYQKYLAAYATLKKALNVTGSKRKTFLRRNIITLCAALSLLVQSDLAHTEELFAVSNEVISYANDEEIKVISSRSISDEDLENAYNNILYSTLYQNNTLESNVTTYSITTPTKETVETHKEPIITYEEMSKNIREDLCLTKAQLNVLLNHMCNHSNLINRYTTKNDALNYLYSNNTYSKELKMLIIMSRENLTYEELDIICAGMVAEGGEESYEEVYRVTSVLYNRSHCRRFIDDFGEGLYNQFTGKNQFSVYSNKSYKNYLGYIDNVGYQAAIDMLFYKTPSVNYLSFRSSTYDVNEQYVQFLDDGNKFMHEMKEDEYVEDSSMEIIEEELEQDEFNTVEFVRKLN